MKRTVLLLTTILITSLFISCGAKPLTDDCGCFMDYDQTISYASKKNKPILVFFTSEGDDDESTLLVSSILKSTSFKQEIASKYVVLHADFSQKAFSKTIAPDNATAEEQELANTYTNIMQNNYQLAVLFNISQMPGVFLCTSQGYVVDRLDKDTDITTYDSFEQQLASKQDDLKKFNSLYAETKKGSDMKRVEAVDNLYIATNADYRSFLLPLLKYALQLDPDNKTGIAGKLVFAQTEIESLFAFSQGDVETAVKQYLIAADNEYVKAEEKQECLFKAAYLAAYSGSDDYEGILTYLETAYNFAPESSTAPAIKTAIENIQANIAGSSDNDEE